MANNQDVYSAFSNLNYSNYLEAIVNGYAAITIPEMERRGKASISIQTLTNQQCNKSVETEPQYLKDEVIHAEKSTQSELTVDIPNQMEIIDDDESVIIKGDIKDVSDIKDISVSAFCYN